MKIIFLDQLGCHAAVLAASYRAGIIGGNPTIREICSLTNFAYCKDLGVGKLYYIGIDPAGAQVYTLGVGNRGALITVAARDLLKIQELKEAVYLVDVTRFNTLLTRLSWQVNLIGLFKPAAVSLAARELKKMMAGLIEYVTMELEEKI